MDERQIALFDQELLHLRETAAEFGRAFPEKARGLALGAQPPDPYVERLLEGTAFLAARVRRELDGQFPAFTQGLLETLHPDWLAPVPSLALLKLTAPRGSPPPPGGLVVRRDTRVQGVPREPGDARALGGESAPCVFTLAQEVRVLPVELIEARLLAGAVHESGADQDFGAAGALRLRLRKTAPVPWAEIALDPLTLYLPRQDGLEHRLLEQILAHSLGLSVRAGGRTVWKRKGPAARAAGFADEAALLPATARTFSGSRLLREYFALPERFLFLALEGFRAALAGVKTEELELILALGEVLPGLEPEVNRACFELFCAPAINLFPKQFSQMINPALRAEFHVVPDQNRPLDFEVYDLARVEGYRTSAPEPQLFRPFFQVRHQDTPDAAHYTVKRRLRMSAAARRGRAGEEALAAYPGSEIYLALADPRQPPVAEDLAELAFQARCTNRHLPLALQEGRGVWSLAGGVQAGVEVLAGPTTPHFLPVEGDYAWRLLNLLSLNYFSFAADPDAGGARLREWLELHAQASTRRAGGRGPVAALRRLHAAAALRLLPAADGRPGLLRGLELTLEVEEAALAAEPVFLLGLVLEEFFARYGAINSFTETVLKTWPNGQERMRWPARAGRRALL